MTQMDKEYIEKEYEQAIKEYNAALTEDDLDTAIRNSLAPPPQIHDILMDILAPQCRKIANNDGLSICPSSPY